MYHCDHSLASYLNLTTTAFAPTSRMSILKAAQTVFAGAFVTPVDEKEVAPSHRDEVDRAAALLGGGVEPTKPKPTHRVLTKAVDKAGLSICHRGRTCVNPMCLKNPNRLHMHLIAELPDLEQAKKLAHYELVSLRNSEIGYNASGCVDPTMDYWHTHEEEFKKEFPKEAEAYFAKKTASTQLPSVPPIWTPPTGHARSSSTSRMTRPNSATRLVGGEIMGSANRTPSLTISLDTGANPGSARLRSGSRAGNRRTYGPR